MMLVGIVLTVVLIGGLFYLDRADARTSKALWIPFCWLAIVGSRPLSMWLSVHRDVSALTQYTESSPVDAAFFAVLIAASLVVLNRRWGATRRLLEMNLPLLIYFVYCAVSISWTDDPAIAAKRWVKAVGEFLVVLVALSDPQPLPALKRMFSRLSFLMVPLSILFIYFIPSMGSSFDPTDNRTIYFGVCTWKNQLGVLCMVAGLTSLWQLLDAFKSETGQARMRRMAAHGFVLLASAGLIVKADAMTSFSCLGLASVVLFVLMSTRPVHRPAAVFSLVTGAVSVALFALFVLPTMLASLGRDSTLTGRTQIWSAVLAQHTNPFVGTGFESFWMGGRMLSVWSLSQYGIEEAHNGYLEMYINLGWIGVGILAVLIVSGYVHAASIFRRDPRAGSVRLALLAAALIFNCTEAGFRMQTLIWIGFLFAITNVPSAAEQRRAGFRVAGQSVLFGPRRLKVLQ